MKSLIGNFFRTVHAIVGPLLLLIDRLTAPAGLQRTRTEQQRVDERTRNLVLYQFLMCPFCVAVRRTIRRLSLNIATRDALRDPASREQLLQGGGELQVPCLRITDETGRVSWMYESAAIIRYLHAEYAPAQQRRRP